MILFASNADTELLALRSVVDDLPAEVGGVRWFHPTGSTACPRSTGRTSWWFACWVGSMPGRNP